MRRCSSSRFRISAYDGSEDRIIANVKDPESGIVWEKHSPGYWSVALNCGNSSTCASWLGYILDGDYEKCGYLLFQRSDVMNWFLHDGYYYFIDMTHFRNDYDTRYRGVEDGDISSCRKSDTLLSNIHKAESFDDYVSYILFALLHSDNTAPSLIFSIEGTEVPDLAFDSSGEVPMVIIDETFRDDFTLLHIGREEIAYGFRKNSTHSVNWKKYKRHPPGSITEEDAT